MSKLEQIARAIDAMDWHQLDQYRKWQADPAISALVRPEKIKSLEKKAARSLLRAKAAVEALRLMWDEIEPAWAEILAMTEDDPEGPPSAAAYWDTGLDFILSEAPTHE